MHSALAQGSTMRNCIIHEEVLTQICSECASFRASAYIYKVMETFFIVTQNFTHFSLLIALTKARSGLTVSAKNCKVA